MSDEQAKSPGTWEGQTPTGGDALDAAPGVGEPGAVSGRTRLGLSLRRLLVPVLAFVTALVIGAFVIVLSDPDIMGLWLTDPLRALGESIGAVAEGYGALFSGALGNPETYVSAFASGDVEQIKQAFYPVSESLLAATPLIFTGLAAALAFRSGLFNIGAEGQLYLGAIVATWVGFSFHGLPIFIHLPLAIAAGFLGGALWAFIPGFLKARTGAHEVIVTIMLNYTAYQLLNWILRQSWYQRPGRSDPISPIVDPSAVIPQIIDGLRVNWAFVLALLAAVAVSWLLFRSTLGFEFRAVGFNPSAARYAGMSISRALILTMVISGGLAGLAGATEILGVTKTVTPGFSPGYGFDGLAIALLGGSSPLGVV
ncbi:MAG: putative transporter permease protein, partial [Chloroflexi bacterium]|nr:putative transporter permease protein [Chloroflexota bacterium]